MTSSLLSRSLGGCAVVALLSGTPAVAWAIISGFTVGSGQTVTTSKTLGGTETGTIASGGTLRTTGVAITQNSTASNVQITNAGSVISTGDRAITTDNNNRSRVITLTNQAGALIRSDADDALKIRKKVSSSGSITIDNAGTISAAGSTSGQALDLRDMTETGVTLTITNRSGGVIEALKDDAIRPGLNATIDNSGTIHSSGSNTKGGVDTYETSDAIDAGARTGVVVTNRSGGLITGARHGVTADTSIEVVNEAGGSIIGRNGSGVGSDGSGTVTNRGVISGDYAGAGNIFDNSGAASLNGDGDGVDIDLIGTIVNYGTIRGTGAGGVDSGGRPNGSEGVAMGGGSITNHAGATIVGAKRGILVDDGAEGSAVGATTIVNDGTIEGQAASAITLVGTYNDGITNSGSILGVGVAIEMGAGDDTLTITGGTITGSVDGGDGTDTLAFALGSGGAFTVSGAYTGFETTTLNGGTLTVSGSVSGPVTMTGGTLNGAGSVGGLSVGSGATVSPGTDATTATLSSTGSVMFAAGSTLKVNVGPTSGDLLAVTGAVAINGGALSLVAESGAYQNVTRNVITATGGVTGGFSSVSFADPVASSGLAATATRSSDGLAYQVTLNGCAFGAGAQVCAFSGYNLIGSLDGRDGDDAVTLQGSGSVSAGIVNVDLIQVGTADGLSTAVTFESGSTQSVARLAVMSNAAAVINGTLTASTSATVASSGSLTVGGTLNGAVTSSGSLTVGGTLSGAVTMTGGTLNGAGSVGGLSVGSGATVSPGTDATTATLSSTGATSFAAGSTLKVNVGPTSGDLLAVTGAVAINGGALSLVAESGNYTNVTRNVITATGGVTGAFSSISFADTVASSGLTATAARSSDGLSYQVTLNGCTLNSGSQVCVFRNQTLTGTLNGQGGGDTFTLQGGNTVAGDIVNVDLIQVGTADAQSTAVTFASGSAQSVARLSVLTNAAATIDNALTASTSATVASSGSLIVNGTLTSASVSVAAGGTLGGRGRIVGTLTNNGGTISPGASPGVLAVDGSMSISDPASTLLIDIDGPTAGTGAGYHDQIVVTGTPGVFTAGGTLAPITRGITGSANNTYTPTIGQGFTIVTASGGVTGSFIGLTQPTDGLPSGTRFDTVYGSNAVTLYLTPSDYGRLSTAGIATTANQSAVGGAVQALRPVAGVRPSSALKPLFDALYPLESSAVPGALDQLSGVIHAESALTTRSAARLFGDALSARAGELRSGSTKASGAWVRGFGRFTESAGDGNSKGFSSRESGFALGVDRAIDPTLTVGAAFGHVRSRYEARGRLGSTDGETFAGGVYGNWTEGGWYALAQAMYAGGDLETGRSIHIGGASPLSAATKSNAGSRNAGAALDVGRVFDWEGTRIEPSVGLRYDNTVRDGFTETGAGALDLSVRREISNSLRSSLGLRVSRAFTVSEVVFEPVLRARWDREILDRSGSVRASMSGAEFKIAGTGTGRDAAVLGVGGSARIDETFQAFVDYETEIRDNATSHAVRAGLRLTW